MTINGKTPEENLLSALFDEEEDIKMNDGFDAANAMAARNDALAALQRQETRLRDLLKECQTKAVTTKGEAASAYGYVSIQLDVILNHNDS